MMATRPRIRRIEKTEPPTLYRLTDLGTSLKALARCVQYRQWSSYVPVG